MNKSLKHVYKYTLTTLISFITTALACVGLFLNLNFTTENNSIVPAAFLGGGAGNINDPWIIETKQHLKDFADAVNEGNSYAGRYFKLETDIDFRDERESNREDHYMSFRGVGVYGHAGGGTGQHSVPFCGNFDGGGHTIQGFYINTNAYAVLTDHDADCDKDYQYGTMALGFFAALGKSASVTNLRLANFELICNYQKPASASGAYAQYSLSVGAIAGAVVAPATVGQNAGTITIWNCAVENVKVSKNSNCLPISFYLGGLVGAFISWNSKPTVHLGDCYLSDITIANNMYTAGSFEIYGGAIWGVNLEPGINTSEPSFIKNCVLAGNNSAPTGQYIAFRLSDIAGNISCTTQNVHLTTKTFNTSSLGSVSSTTGSSGSTWYLNSNFNNGYPYLRIFMKWSTIKFEPNHTSYGSVSPSQVIVPTAFLSSINQDLQSQTKLQTLSVFGTQVTATESAGCEFKKWECKSATSYIAHFEEAIFDVYFSVNSNCTLKAVVNNNYPGTTITSYYQVKVKAGTSYTLSYSNYDKSGSYKSCSISLVDVNGTTITIVYTAKDLYYISEFKFDSSEECSSSGTINKPYGNANVYTAEKTYNTQF